jgi:hypothetical protein
MYGVGYLVCSSNIVLYMGSLFPMLVVICIGRISNFLWVELEHLIFQGYNVKFV